MLGHIVIDCHAGIMSLYGCDITLFVSNGVSEETAQSVTPLSLGSHCMLGEPLLALYGSVDTIAAT